jgi:UDP-N-acetylmuramate dehydrogenase
MAILENISLQNFNSFRIAATARFFSSFSSLEDLQSMPLENHRLLVLGGGSNLLFTGDFDGLVLKNEMKGIEELHEDERYIYVKAGAGENWHQFVQYCIGRGWAGLENLSLIPGSVGASPMQNIGAYGVELEQSFWDLEAYSIHDRRLVTFTHSDCAFGYRESVFKRKLKNQFIILNVTFRLDKKPVFHTSYGAITQELEKMGVKELSIRAISTAVINIRQSKLPDPSQIGNAGSFFKNPSVSVDQYQSLQQQFPGIVGYRNPDGSMKLAAGWLIEQCGWKGYKEGDAGCHANQALVLVNYGNATGKQLFQLSEKILVSVKAKFGVELEREVNVF